MFQFVFEMLLKMSSCQDITLLDMYRKNKTKQQQQKKPNHKSSRVNHVLIHVINFCHTFAWWGFA